MKEKIGPPAEVSWILERCRKHIYAQRTGKKCGICTMQKGDLVAGHIDFEQRKTHDKCIPDV